MKGRASIYPLVMSIAGGFLALPIECLLSPLASVGIVFACGGKHPAVETVLTRDL